MAWKWRLTTVALLLLVVADRQRPTACSSDRIDPPKAKKQRKTTTAVAAAAGWCEQDGAFGSPPSPQAPVEIFHQVWVVSVKPCKRLEATAQHELCKEDCHFQCAATTREREETETGRSALTMSCGGNSSAGVVVGLDTVERPAAAAEEASASFGVAVEREGEEKPVILRCRALE